MARVLEETVFEKRPGARADGAAVVTVGGVRYYAKLYRDETLAARIRATYPASRVALAREDLAAMGLDTLAEPVYFCTCKGKMLAVVSRFVEGVDLDQAAASPMAGVEEAKRWALALSATIAALTVRGVVHGDLRPGNIMVDGRSPVVVDLEGAGTPSAPPVFVTDFTQVDYELPPPPKGPWGRDVLGLYWSHLALAAATSREVSTLYLDYCCGPDFYRRARRDPGVWRHLRIVLGRLLEAYWEWAETGVVRFNTPLQVYLAHKGGRA